MKFELTGYSKEIYKLRYAFTEEETWDAGCRRVARQMALAELPEKQKVYEDKFYDILSSNQFIPGGRIFYGSGRTNPNLLNCFVLGNNLDSKEGWGQVSKELIVTSMTGGGCGIDATDVRPKDATISGHRGTCPGPLSLFELLDGNAEPVRAGGERRVALMFSLGLDHPDVVDFMDAKRQKGKLTHANVSVRSTRTHDFIRAIRNNEDWELSWKTKYRRTVKAKELWDKIVKNAYDHAEPGFLNWELVENESNIHYIEKLVTTNPCLSSDTLVSTKNGIFQIKDLVGKQVEVLSDGSWVTVDNFRITAKNQPTVKITLYDGSSIKATPYHSFILEDGRRVKAKDLKVQDRLLISEVESHGNHEEKGAYLKGFLVGDGTLGKGGPILQLYAPKFICQDRLIKSAREIPNEKANTSVIQDLYFSEGENRKTLAGLVPKKSELIKWCSEYKKRLPKDIFSWDKKSKSDFIAGVMDADGTASDSAHGFLYQICSVEKVWLEDFQILLKSLGVRSKLSLMKEKGSVDFHDGYGNYETKDCYRLTISQSASILLAKQVEFSRLVSFSNKTIRHNVKPRFNKIVNIQDGGVEENVYCCTIPDTHSFTLANGIEVGQCGEIALSSYDCCCLGHLVLPRFVIDGKLDYPQLANTVRLGVRFLDNVLSVNRYPMGEMADKSAKLRRIGLGTTGLADMLALLGLRYGSEEGNKYVDKLYRFISKVAYEASVILAVEKGPFPACDPSKHVQSGFIKRMPAKIRSLIAEHGIRNCAILTQAPVGTMSIVSGNVSSGIEPMFAPAYNRRYWGADGTRKTELVYHPLFASFLKEGRDVSHFVGSHELDMRDHLEVQKIVQSHVDNAVSKTINMAHDYPIEKMSELWLEYLPYLKGTTFYREGSRGFVNAHGEVEAPPLTPIPVEEAMAKFKEEFKQEAAEVKDCPSGICEL